jgi:hypothetical protein
MTKVIQSTIAERQSEAATATLNFESKLFRQRTGLFDTGVTKALATLTPYTPLSFEGAATAEQAGTIATATVPVVVGLTHLPMDKARFVGPIEAPRAGDFRIGSGKEGIGMPSNKDGYTMPLRYQRKPTYRKRVNETKEEFQNRKETGLAKWRSDKTADAMFPGTYYRAYKDGLVDWLLGIDPITSRGQWSDPKNFNKRRLAYWDRAVPQVNHESTANMDGYVRDFLGASTEAVPFATSQSQSVSAGYGQLEEGADWSGTDSPVMIDAALPIGIRQFRTDEIATNYIANNRNRVVIGYTIGARNVKLFYTPAAIDMVVRRFSSIFELFGTMSPRMQYIGRGHLRTSEKSQTDPQGYELWSPATSESNALEAKRPYLAEPNLNWSSGAVAYNTKQLPANGQIYIDPNQMGYTVKKKFCKYNHVMTQVGLSMMETLQAFGAGLNQFLTPMNQPFIDKDSSAQVTSLQMLFAAMFGTTAASTINVEDWTEDAGGRLAHDRTASILGMFFNPGHSHIDPGVMVYQSALNAEEGPLMEILKVIRQQSSYEEGGAKFDAAFDNDLGMLDRADLRYRLADMDVSAALMMNEAIGRLFVFSVMGGALSQHMTVPTVTAKLEYHNNAARDSVITSLKMAHRPGVVAAGMGGSGLPFDFIDSRITQEVVARIPCYMRKTKANASYFNSYIGISTPDPVGEVADKISENGVCTTMLEGDDIQFTPIVRGGSSSLVTKRKGVSITIAHLARPEYYEPGVSTIGAIYGLMSDNKSVSGNYFLQPSTGVFHDDRVEDTMYRALAGSQSTKLYALVNPDMDRAAINRMTAWYETRSLQPWKNFTYIPIDENGNIDWNKWKLMYVDAGIDISPDTWKRAMLQDVNMSRQSALYPPAAPSLETTADMEVRYERED